MQDSSLTRPLGVLLHPPFLVTMATDELRCLDRSAVNTEGNDLKLTQGVVVQVEDADLGAVGHSNGEAAPALRGDAGVGAQC